MSRRLLCSLTPVLAVALWLGLTGTTGAQDKKAPPAAPTVEVYQDRGDEFRFRIKSGDHILAIASRGYDEEADCLKVIEELKKEMGKAMVVKMTKDKK